MIGHRFERSSDIHELGVRKCAALGALLAGGEQCDDLGVQRPIIAAGLRQPGVAIGTDLAIQSCAHDRMQSRVAIGFRAHPARLNSVCSQARAMNQSFSTVESETCSSSATSATVSPPKIRSSTTRA